jgi:hypothetical protein
MLLALLSRPYERGFRSGLSVIEPPSTIANFLNKTAGI